MSVSASYQSKITVVETIEDSYLSAQDQTVTHSGLDTTATLNAGTSTTPATKVASFQKALSGGAGTIDLRALVGTNGGAVDGNGLRVQLAKFRNKATNANDITIAPGASNGYNLLGSAFSVTLKPGQELTLYTKDGTPDIDATHKTLDLSGTGSQILEAIIVMG